MRQLTPRQLDALRSLAEGRGVSEYPTVTLRSLERASYAQDGANGWLITDLGTRALALVAERNARRSRAYEANFRALMMAAKDLP